MKLLRTILLTSAALGSIYMFTGCQESKTAEADKKITAKPTQPEQKAPPIKEKTIPAPKPKAQPEKAVNAVEKKGTPRIVFAKTSHDFGVMTPDKYYNTEYKFTNAGTGELIVKSPSSTCVCTVPELKKKNYAPGESGTIKIKYHAQKTAGTVNRNIEVRSNDPKTPAVKCFIKGSVELAVTVHPKTLKFSLKEENAGAIPIVIKSTMKKSLSKELVNCGS